MASAARASARYEDDYGYRSHTQASWLRVEGLGFRRGYCSHAEASQSLYASAEYPIPCHDAQNKFIFNYMKT